jgi:hypothetical protein
MIKVQSPGVFTRSLPGTRSLLGNLRKVNDRGRVPTSSCEASDMSGNYIAREFDTEHETQSAH